MGSPFTCAVALKPATSIPASNVILVSLTRVRLAAMNIS
jgi:hypothetical protein